MSLFVNKKTKLSRGIKNALIDFSENTTAHGIPRVGRARTKRARIFWIVVCFICSAVFIYLACQLILRYLRYEKITQIQLEFKNAPFPAVTFCNLNPYKKSLAATVDGLGPVIAAVDAKNKKRNMDTKTVKIGRRNKRIPITYEYRYMPVYAFCRCPNKSGGSECLPFFESSPREKDSQCLCFLDRLTKSPFRCYPVSYWSLRWCTSCEIAGNCPPADISKLERDAAGNVDDAYKYIAPCVCQNVTNYCIATGDKPFGRLWLIDAAKPPPIKPFMTPPPPTTTEPPEDVEKEYPLIEETAKTATSQTIQAVESLTFAAASLSEEEIKRISYKRHEFVKSCTFNQRDCDMDRDFTEYRDPRFGTCFTFNANATANRTSSRAGPMYGLSIILYVNTSDYLPLTNGKGVRMAVHSGNEFPFPDTFGFNAPTGFLTSFGIRLKRVKRIPWPRNDCVIDGRTDDYIYPSYNYSIEGCYRSCLQKLLVNECRCADPLFPPTRDSVHCRLNDTLGRKCINRTKTELGDMHGNYTDKCPKCIQPCEQIVYDVTFSTAIWPHSESINNYLYMCEDGIDGCEENLRDNAAYVEIYYEQLNYESLIESEAYLLANLLADLGGQLGLLLGFSVITCVEFLFLLWDLLRLCYSVEKDKRQKKKEEIRNVNGELFDDSIVSCTVKIGSVKIDENDIEIEQDATQYQMDDDSDSDGNGNKIEYEIEGEGWFKVESGSERSVSNKIEYEPNIEKNQAQFDFDKDINDDNNSSNQAQFEFGKGINDDNNSNQSNNNNNILDDNDFNEEVVLYLPHK